MDFGLCKVDGCTDPIGVKHLGLCHACARWLRVWSNRSPQEVDRRIFEIERLGKRSRVMSLPGHRKINGIVNKYFNKRNQK